MNRTVLFAALIWLSWTSIATACEVGGKQWANSVNRVLLALGEGSYQEVKTVIGQSIRINNRKEFDALINNLERYAPNGFKSCRELSREELPPLATKTLFEFANPEGDGIYVYMFLVDGEVKFRSGIQIFRVSTELENILKIWRNS